MTPKAVVIAKIETYFRVRSHTHAVDSPTDHWRLNCPIDQLEKPLEERIRTESVACGRRTRPGDPSNHYGSVEVMTFLELSLSRSLNVSADVRQRFSGTLTRRTASRLLFKADRDEGRLVNLAHVDTLHLEKRGGSWHNRNC